jgi:CheY-like chemotaxis protein
MTLKLLIADDSATIQKIIALAFSSEDAVVECVSEGDSALQSIQTFKPDVVLADVFMPGCNGYEICARIKEDAKLAHIPVVLLSGIFEPFDEIEASRIKCDGHLTKPFDTSELIETVFSLAGKRTADQKSDKSLEVPVMDMQNNVASAPDFVQPGLKGSIHPRIWDSYLGSDRVLDLFDREVLDAAETVRTAWDRAKAVAAAIKMPDWRSPALPDTVLSEDMLNLIVDKVIRRMSAEIIREVAWEVVPELSEGIIRRTIEEQQKP